MTRNEIASVIRQVPSLTSFGIGLFHNGKGMSPDEKKAAMQQSQNELLDARDQCSKICDWLRSIGKIKSINTRHTSYGLKHIAANAIGYTSNGEFICAAIHMGFDYRIVGPNAQFNMSERDLKVK
jgi:hypothetical protein